jgi:hypothetical protein
VDGRDKLCAQLDGKIHFAGMEGEDAPTGAIAGFEYRDPLARGCEFVGGGEAGDPCADDEYVGRMV